VTDENGCTLTEVILLDSISPKAAFTVESTQLDENCEGTELVQAKFINQSTFFSNPNDLLTDTTFSWNLDTGNAPWVTSDSFFEEFDTSYTGENIYQVCLVAINKNGCSDTTCKDIIVHVQPAFIAPNIFTPGNGINDQFTFEYRAEGIETFHCAIVNRWGVTITELNDITDVWDGTDKKGNDCVAGVYFYTYESVSTNGTVFSGQGTVQLVR